MSSSADLITSTVAQQALAAGGVTLSAAQLVQLPLVITACSRAIVRFCNRPFLPTSYDEIVTPEGGRQDRGEPATAKLTYFPVQSFSRVYTGRSTGLTISNADPVGNQLATVGFTFTGDVEDFDLTYTGIVLTRVASGVTSTSPLLFASYPTVQALAGAISAAGSGWTATVASGTTPDPGLFPSADLVGVREPKNAFSPGATLDLFMQAADGYDIDRATGILRVYDGSWRSGGDWGGAFGATWDDLGDHGGGQLGWDQYRVTYQAGFTTVPEPIQQVCCELVKGTFERLGTDSTLKSENARDYSYTVRDAWATLPDWALQVLTLYKDWKV